MNKIHQRCFSILCIFILVAGTLLLSGKCRNVSADEAGVVHEITPTRVLMLILSSHTSKMLDAIMTGDFDAVVRESNQISESSRNLADMFFPGEGKKPEFKMRGGDEITIKISKTVFEKYAKIVTEASQEIAESSRKKNIVETYNSFDAMIRNACIACHTASRSDWPDWTRNE